jgi:arsenate reductase (glutaredoxin)
MLESPPAELVRKDKRFEELKLKATDYTSKAQVIALLIEHPELMQRPIVVRGSRAVIARPPDKLDVLF